VLDRLPKKEKKLSAHQKPSEDDPVEPRFPVPGGPEKLPEKPKDETDAAKAALEEAFRRFSDTELGKQLEKSAIKYVLSWEGLPFDLIVLSGVATFVAKNDPSLPSSPDIPLGDGIKIKLELGGKASQLPPLVQDLVTHGRSEHPPQKGQDESKVAVTVTFTNEGLITAAKAIGHFFAEAATWVAKGVVKVGMAIGKAAKSIWRELVGLAAGGALGAIIGGIAGGGIGAAIGAGIGAAVGLAVGGISHLLANRSNKKKEPAKAQSAAGGTNA
jgi:hypothetical protein